MGVAEAKISKASLLTACRLFIRIYMARVKLASFSLNPLNSSPPLGLKIAL